MKTKHVTRLRRSIMTTLLAAMGVIPTAFAQVPQISQLVPSSAAPGSVTPSPVLQSV